ncbi:PREDICTED: subtilisin-like protease SBT3.4 [Camelina sativa]|uniref:Subtilisin-like protease SBT3.4 n=1 Tax=Camelina sativa TaxID=90675 RepID=A0ABM0STI2_CAMSA|nr:PREDICTED: subtilisin-like protease SBT3.4 [Camelina sativa]
MQRVRLNLIVVLVFFSSLLASIVMAETTGDATVSSEAKVHIVYTEKPTDEEPKTYHLRTVSSALGSEEAANDALIYSYREAASGFSAKLTPEQVAEISKQPGVIQVVPSQTYQLHKPVGGASMLS